MTDREKFDSFLNGIYRPRSDDEIDFEARTITSKISSKGIKLYIYKRGWSGEFEAQDPRYSYKFEAYIAESDEYPPAGVQGNKKYVIVPSEEYFRENKADVLYQQGFISSPSASIEEILYAYSDFTDAIATEESIKKGIVTRKSKWQLAYESVGSCYWLPAKDKPNCSEENKIFKNSPVDAIEGVPESPEEVELPPELAPADTGKKITVYLYNESSGRWQLGHQTAEIFENHKDLLKRNPPAFLGNYWKYMYTSSTGFAFSQLEYPIPIEGSEYNEMREMTLYERYKAGLYQLQPDDEVDDANKVIRKKKPGETPKPGEGGGTSPKPGEDENKPKPGEGGSEEGGKKPDKKRPNVPKIRPSIPNIPRFNPSNGFVRPRPSPVEPARPLPTPPAPVKPEPARPEPAKPIPPIPEPKIDLPLPPQPDKGKLQLLATGEIKLSIPEGGTMSTGTLKIKFIFPVKNYEIIQEMEGEF